MFSPTLRKTLLKRYNLKTLQSIFSFFFITCIFVWKKLWIGIKGIFINVEKKLKTFSRILFSVFYGAPLTPFEHTIIFFRKVFFFLFVKNIYKKCIWHKFKTFSQKNQVIKKKEIVDCKVFKLQRLSKVFPNVSENALFWRDH